jgi:UDP-N-acetylmuramyl pentapeptide phosphotransferase/UDP-N-acetylglucosamine-1-phosphate transferase
MYLIVTSNSYSNKSILMYFVGVCLGFLVLNKLTKKIVRNRQGLS